MPVRLTPRRLSAAVAAVLTLAAVTAFGVVPIDTADLPPAALVREQVRAREAAVVTSDAAVFERQERVQRGDTLGALLDRLGVRDEDLLGFVRVHSVARQLLQPQPGRMLSARVDGQGRLVSLHYLERPADLAAQARKLTVDRDAHGQLRARTEAADVFRSVAIRAAEVRTTLQSALDSAGIPDEVARQLPDVFEGQLDFNRQIGRGDRVRLVYEVVQLADSLEPPQPGRILAAEVVDGRRTYRAVWFERTPGRGEYFDYDGKSIKKGFLRAPLDFVRITSGFTEERLHPIWHDVRPHRGIDFAAPLGTPVHAIGDGVVESVGMQSGYGNVVVMRHQGDITTLYAHLNAFAPGLKVGSQLAQGELLGEVGRTGWATGPHLHFEFRIAGEHVDPQSVDLPNSRPLDLAERSRFDLALAQARHQIALLDSIQLARFE